MKLRSRGAEELPKACLLSRRELLSLPVATVGVRGEPMPAPRPENAPLVTVSVGQSAAAPGFDKHAFGTVGVYDVDWLTQPRFARLLDNLAASPGAFQGVRFFGSFTAGKLEALAPDGGGTVWPSVDAEIDFSPAFRAFEALTSRGLVPFVSLGFFPGAVSPSPIVPPSEWDDWKTLVRAFFAALAADRRFGPEAIRDWWFEVWNEPNEGRFWSGTPVEYLALYRATSEAVAESGVAIRLGGPAIAYKPQVDPASGAPWIERFLRFIAAAPELQCDFVSFHRKGTVGDDPPDPRRLFDAAAATAELALAIDPIRFANVTIVDDEADEKVGFEVPYAPRLDHRNAAWLGAATGIHALLAERYRNAGLQFVAAADNADLQLVQAPFDGRRSIMTLARPGVETDLLKVPAYGFYELLRLLGDRLAPVISGGEAFFPTTDLYHVATFDDDGVAILLAYYPNPDVASPPARAVDYLVRDLPWPRINIARFQIDRAHSNSYSAAGGSDADPFPVPDPERLPAIRLAQEIGLARPIARNLAAGGGAYRETIELAPFTTACLWITPTSDAVPSVPSGLVSEASDGNVSLRWNPNRESCFFSYEVFLVGDGSSATRISPDPLRAALWVDTAPPPGPRNYAVGAVSVSGVASELSESCGVLVGK
jgi:hypothetical protein